MRKAWPTGSSGLRVGTALMVVGVGLGSLVGVGVVRGAQAPTGEPQGGDWRQPPRQEWPTVGGDWGNTRYSALTRINVSTVKSLAGAWVRELDTESRATPVVQNGLMFTASARRIYALNAATGAVVWTHSGEIGTHARKGVAVGDGLVFAGFDDASIIALRQQTGDVVWRGRIGDDPPKPGQQSTSPPAYANGVVVAGLANGDFGIRGRVVGLDAATGRQLWVFHTIPEPGAPGSETWPKDTTWAKVEGMTGGGVWMQPAVDPDLGLAYVGVGNAVPQFGGELRPGDNLFNASVIALDLKTGQLRWYYQLVHHDIWDHDLGTPMVLYDAMVDGRPRKALAAMRTDGYLFLLDRETGKPVLPVEERPVPQDVRLKTAPTQPFPVGADRVGPDCVDATMIPPGFQPLCWFDPLYFDRPNVVTPAIAMRAAPMSYSPQTGYFYATGGHSGWWYRRVENPYVFIPARIPGQKEYGIIAAIDSRTNKIVWQHKTTYSHVGGGGALTTAGGLLFVLQPTGVFQALDAKSGRTLWEFQTGYVAARTPVSLGGGAPAITYEIDGKQYVAVTSGRGLVAFALDGTMGPRSAPPPPPTVFPFGGLTTEFALEDTPDVTVGFRMNTGTAEQYWDEYAFRPVRIKVKVGTTVRWTNHGAMPHTITTRDGAWSTGPIRPGQTGTARLVKPGTYVYICKDHPWSQGELTVVP